MQPHITPVCSALSSRHRPQSNNHHWTLVCMSMKARRTQILVSIECAQTNAPSIGPSRSGTSAVQSAWPALGLPAASPQHTTVRNPRGHRPASYVPGPSGPRRGGKQERRRRSGGRRAKQQRGEARTNVEEPLVSALGKKKTPNPPQETSHSLQFSHSSLCGGQRGVLCCEQSAD